MRGIILAIFGLALHVNAQFKLNIGPPTIHLEMFGKEIINVGKNKKHAKKSKAHQRKKKQAMDRKTKPDPVLKPQEHQNGDIKENDNKEEDVKMELIPLPQPDNFIDSDVEENNEIEQVEQEQNVEPKTA